MSGKPFIIDAFNEVPEINRSIPEKEYDWIVNSLSDLIRKKANSDEKNRTLFN